MSLKYRRQSQNFIVLSLSSIYFEMLCSVRNEMKHNGKHLFQSSQSNRKQMDSIKWNVYESFDRNVYLWLCVCVFYLHNKDEEKSSKHWQMTINRFEWCVYMRSNVNESRNLNACMSWWYWFNYECSLLTAQCTRIYKCYTNNRLINLIVRIILLHFGCVISISQDGINILKQTEILGSIRLMP